MIKKLMLLTLLGSTVFLQGMDAESLINLLELDASAIEKTCERLLSLDKRVKYMRPLAIAAIVGGVGYGVKKWVWDAKENTIAQAETVLRNATYDNLSEEDKRVMAAKLLTDLSDRIKAEKDAAAKRTFKESFAKGLNDYWIDTKKNLPWVVSFIGWKVISHGQSIIDDALPSVDKLMDNFFANKTLGWFVENRTNYIFAIQNLVAKAKAIAIGLLFEERAEVEARMIAIHDAYSAGANLTNEQIQELKGVSARFKELENIEVPREDELELISNNILVSGATLMREIEKIVGYIEYAGTKIDAEETTKIAQNSMVKNTIILQSTKLRDAVLSVVGESMDVKIAQLNLVRQVIEKINAEINSYATVEN